jgi:hypothetical protein
VLIDRLGDAIARIPSAATAFLAPGGAVISHLCTALYNYVVACSDSL